MQTRTTLLSAALGFVLLVGPTRAADLPKEGTFTATYSATGTSKVMLLGEERWFSSFEEHGLSVGSGLFDHATWHCWGMGEGIKTIATDRAYCVVTDPRGDQIAAEAASDGKVDYSKSFNVIGTITAGTGKYAGISGGWSFTAQGSEFKASEGSEGRYVDYGPFKGSYKLP